MSDSVARCIAALALGILIGGATVLIVKESPDQAYERGWQDVYREVKRDSLAAIPDSLLAYEVTIYILAYPLRDPCVNAPLVVYRDALIYTRQWTNADGFATFYLPYDDYLVTTVFDDSLYRGIIIKVDGVVTDTIPVDRCLIIDSTDTMPAVERDNNLHLMPIILSDTGSENVW